MRLLGVLGGMSWTSTESYYRQLNQGVAERLGGLHSARLLVHSVDFDEIAVLQHADDWPATAEILGRVDDLVRLGLRAPQVTSFAHALAPAATDLPLTVPEAVRWLEARS